MTRRRAYSHERSPPAPLGALYLVASVSFFVTFFWSAEGPRALHAQAPTGATPAAPPTSPFTSALRTQFTNQLRARAAEERAVVLRELGRYPDAEAARLIVQYGLRDRTASVYQAATEALTASRGASAVDAFLLELFRDEFAAAKRPYPDFARRLALAVASRRSAATWTELTRRALQSDAEERDLCLDALLMGIDEAAADRDLAVLPHLATLSRTPLFAYSQGCRKCLLDAVCQLDAAAGLGLLVECLPKIDGELRGDVVEYLSRATKQKWGDDPAAWQRWWSQEQARQTAAGRATEEAGAAPPRLTAGAPRVANSGAPLYYYDLPVRADRVVFVLDVSKSMGLGGGASRLAAAQRELVKTLEKLPEETMFNVIVFEAKPTALAERLQRATPAMRAHAVRFVRNQRAQGKTATYDALHQALTASPEPEVVYLLSDGMPSVGAVAAPDKVLQSIQSLNRTRRIKVHTLGTLAGPQDAAFGEFLRQLAEQNYGEFRRLE